MAKVWRSLKRIHCDGTSFAVLVVLTIFLISSFALITQPSPLEGNIIRVLDVDTTRYGALMSLCSWASLLDVVHGYLLDRYVSIMAATWIYCALVIVGSAIYSVAGFTKSYSLLILGRLLYGLGVNPLLLVNNKHMIHWFGKGKYVNFIYSYGESIFWLGASLIFLVTAPYLDWLRESNSEDRAFAIANVIETVVLSVLSTLPMIVLAFMYNWNSKKNSSTAGLPETPAAKEWSTDAEPTTNNNKPSTFKDYVCMPLIFWVFSLSVFLYYLSILGFISMSILFFKTEFGLSEGYAGTLSSLISLIAAVGGPLVGLLLDKIGHNLSSLTLAVLLNLVGQILLGWTDFHPLIAIVLMGLSLVFCSGLWSQFQFLVNDHQYMIAYGVAQTGLNGAQAVGTVIAGSIIDKYAYRGFMIYQISLIICSIPVVALVWFLDAKQDFFLNKTSKKKNIILGRLAASDETQTDNKGIDNEGYTK